MSRSAEMDWRYRGMMCQSSHTIRLLEWVTIQPKYLRSMEPLAPLGIEEQIYAVAGPSGPPGEERAYSHKAFSRLWRSQAGKQPSRQMHPR